jgi:hypothetical protein
MLRIANEHEREAIGLYAVLARDPMDFLEMANEISDAGLDDLYLMLTTPHPDHDKEIVELNTLGADLLKGEFKRRKREFPKPVHP